MPFTIERNDLAQVHADVIVVTANEGLQINGGVGLAVARAAGLSEMQAACDALGGCPTGQAVATPAFNLDASHVVHVVGPVWRGGGQGEESLLRQAYDNALACADECGAQTIALPLVSARTFGFPVRLSFSIAVEAIKNFLEDHDDTEIRLVLFGEDAMAVGLSFYDSIAEYIDSHYVEEAEPQSGNAQSAPYFSDQALQGLMLAERREKRADVPSVPSSAGYAARQASPKAESYGKAPKGSKRRRKSLGALGEAVAGAIDHISGLRDSAKEEPLEGGFAPGRDEFWHMEAAHIDFDQHDEDGLISDDAPYTVDACPHCGHPVQGGIFCPGCGYRLAAGEQDELVQTYATRPPDGSDLPSFESTSVFAGAEPLQPPSPAGPAGGSLTSWLDRLDAPFSTTLLALIDERGLTDAQVYKRANMSRQLFSKIRSDPSYRPAKRTVLALSIALGLDLGETADLLRRAGFALSHSNKADVIVEYFIVKGNYDIFAVNEALYAFDQTPL